MEHRDTVIRSRRMMALGCRCPGWKGRNVELLFDGIAVWMFMTWLGTMRRRSERDLAGGRYGEQGSALAQIWNKTRSRRGVVGEEHSGLQAELKLARQAPAESTVDAIMYEVQAVTTQLVAPFRITAGPRKYLADWIRTSAGFSSED